MNENQENPEGNYSSKLSMNKSHLESTQRNQQALAHSPSLGSMYKNPKGAEDEHSNANACDINTKNDGRVSPGVSDRSSNIEMISK